MKKRVVFGLVALLVVGGGVFVATRSNDDNSMEGSDQATLQGVSLESEFIQQATNTSGFDDDQLAQHHFVLALTQRGEGNESDALENLIIANDLQPGNYEYIVNLMLAYSADDQFAEAESLLELSRESLDEDQISTLQSIAQPADPVTEIDGQPLTEDNF